MKWTMPSRHPVVLAAIIGGLVVSSFTAAGAAVAADAPQNIDDATVYGTNSFTYDSIWGTATGVGDLFGGTAHWTKTAGASASFAFQGTHVALYGVKDVDQGMVTFSLDGGNPVTVDDYAPSRTAEAVLFDSGTLAEGTHTLIIRATGTNNAASKDHIVAVDYAAIVGPTPPPFVPTLTADLGATAGAFSAGAAGSLYGINQSGIPSDNIVGGMGLTTLATKAQDGQQHPGADALEVYPTFRNSGGEDEYIYMTDVYRNFPYERTSYDQYRSYMATEVKQVLAAGVNSHIVFIPYNEPDGNWFPGIDTDSSVLASFNAEWLQSFQLIRSLDPQARIAGPNLSWYYPSMFTSFLSFCKANACLPDVVTWHELGSPADLRANVSAYRALEKQVGINPIPVNLDEYAPPVALDNPGAMVPWISAITDSGVQGDLAYWRVAGSMDDSIAQQNVPNAQWWLYNWYAGQHGQRVVVSSNEKNTDGTPQGVSSVDSGAKTARVILSGGGSTGTVNAVIKNIPSAWGSSVHVTVAEDKWSGNTGAASTPTQLSDGDVSVAGGSITIPITASAMSAYEITIQPGGTGSAVPSYTGFSRSYEAEAATMSGTGYNTNTETNDATSGGKDVGGLRTGSSTVMTFNVNVPTTGTYNVRVFDGSNSAASNVNGPTTVYLRVDGGPSQPISLPTAYNWTIWNNVDASVALSAGTHTISLATTGDNGGATSGDAIIDKIDLTQITATSTTYQAEQAWLAGGASPSYTSTGQHGSGTVPLSAGQSATFWVYSAVDGYSDLTLRALGTGTAKATVNGIAAYSSSPGSATKWSTPTNAVHLEKGINRVTVTGTSGTVQIDELTATPHPAGDALSTRNTQTVQAETGTLSGTAATSSAYTQANGSVVTGTAAGEANSLTVTVNAPAAGTYDLTLRYANNQQLPSNHYNPDLMDQTATLRVNGASATQKIAFGPTYSWNQFFTVTVPVTLKLGANSLKFWADQQYNWDGTTIGTVYSGDGGVGSPLRSNQAPNIDQISISPTTAR